MQEVKFNYQNISILFEKEGKFTVVNKNLFANTDRFRCVAVLQKNGVVVKKQEIETTVPPLSTKDYEIPFAILRADDKDQKKRPGCRIHTHRFIPVKGGYELGRCRT